MNLSFHRCAKVIVATNPKTLLLEGINILTQSMEPALIAAYITLYQYMYKQYVSML